MRPAPQPIGSKIKRARERLRLTQQQLADLVRVSQKTIDNWENDRRYPKSAIGALEAALDVRLTDNEPPARRPWDEYDEAIDNLQAELDRLRSLRNQEPGKEGNGGARFAI